MFIYFKLHINLVNSCFFKKNIAGKYGGYSLLLRRLIFETEPQY